MPKTISLIGVPLDHNSSYMRGPAKAPYAAVEALHCDSANMWTETGHTMAGVIEHAGLIELGEPSEAFDRIEKAAAEAGRADSTPIFIGGDHSVTYPLVRGMREAVGDFSILHFDAHPDCYPVYNENLHSHACPFARIMEDGLCSRLVSIGIRTASNDQRELKAKYGIEWLEMKDQADWPVISFDTPVYVTVDMDALDPAFAPGVSHHEPGGMSTRQLLDIILSLDAPIIGADIVELNPDRDINSVTAMTAAKILREIGGMILEQ